MVPEVVLSAEALATHITWIWSLVSVCALMDQQVVGLGEMAATESADELLPGSVRSIDSHIIAQTFDVIKQL